MKLDAYRHMRKGKRRYFKNNNLCCIFLMNRGITLINTDIIINLVGEEGRECRDREEERLYLLPRSCISKTSYLCSFPILASSRKGDVRFRTY